MSPRTKRLDRAAREALRKELYARLEAGTLDLAEATRMMRGVLAKSQREYARWLEVSHRTLIDIERGSGNPTVETLEKLARPFGLRVVYRLPPRQDSAAQLSAADEDGPR